MSLCISSVIRFMVSCSSYVTVVNLVYRICGCVYCFVLYRTYVNYRMLVCVTINDTKILCVMLELNAYVDVGYIYCLLFIFN